MNIWTKNLMTGETEKIQQHELETTGWGFRFFVDNEYEAYRAAHHFRKNPYGCRIEYAKGVHRWMVTVFNENAASMGIDV